MSLFIIIATSGLLFLSDVLALDVRPCGKRPLPLNVFVEGCEKEPCDVTNKRNIHFGIDFLVGMCCIVYLLDVVFNFFYHYLKERPTETLTAAATAFLDDIVLPYEVPKNRQDACKFLKNAQCPLTAGMQVHYELVAPVDAPITGPTVDLQFELKDDTGKDVFCIKAKVHIVEKKIQ